MYTLLSEPAEWPFSTFNHQVVIGIKLSDAKISCFGISEEPALKFTLLIQFEIYLFPWKTGCINFHYIAVASQLDFVIEGCNNCIMIIGQKSERVYMPVVIAILQIL